MNTDKLTRIRAKCAELLAMAERRTQGRWGLRRFASGEYSVLLEESELYVSGRLLPQDADFIASCAGTAEAGWKATIAAIDIILSGVRTSRAGEVDFLLSDAKYANAIEAAWSEELL